MDETAYDRERAAILSTAVGLARYALGRGDTAAAARYLGDASARTHNLLRTALIEDGHDPDAVDSFLGSRFRDA
jgi:hypothetical protein